MSELEIDGYKKWVCVTPVRQEENCHAIQYAQRLAKFFDAKWVTRDSRSIAKIFSDTGAEVIVVAADWPVFYHRDQTENGLQYHPGMSTLRLQTLLQGGTDRLLQAAQIRPSDWVLDATCGLASDAVVLSYAVGRQGKVTALEKSPVIYRMLQHAQTEGLEHLPQQISTWLSRIDLLHQDALQFLRQSGHQQYDVIYIDPMFQEPIMNSPGIAALRPFAYKEPLDEILFAEACRVTRQRVVIKARAHDSIWRRLPIQPDKLSGRVRYGIWERGGT